MKSAVLYMEERIFLALNFINSVNRYSPMLRERSLGWGYSRDTDGPVLVREDLRGLGRPAATPAARQEHRARARRREGGLPAWLWSAAGDPEVLGPDDPSLEGACTTC